MTNLSQKNHPNLINNIYLKLSLFNLTHRNQINVLDKTNKQTQKKKKTECHTQTQYST